MRNTYPMTKLPIPADIVVMNGVWYQRKNLLATREWLMSQLAGNKRSAWERKFMKSRADEIDAALNKERKSNPAGKKVIRRKGMKRSKYVTRRSQITGKPPTKRLKKRRAKAVAASKKGYFPNPGKVRVIRENPAQYVYFVRPEKGELPHTSKTAINWRVGRALHAPAHDFTFVIPTDKMDFHVFKAWFDSDGKKRLYGSKNDLKKFLGQFLLRA